MPSRLRLTLAALLAAGALAGCGAAVVPAIHSDASRVGVARGLYDRREFLLAADVLTSYATTGTGNADIDQAVYLLGLCYLGQKDWVNAQMQFERMARDYPESDSAGPAAFQLAEALYGQSRPFDYDQEYTLRALTQFEAFRRDYPGGVYDGAADRRIAELRTRLARKLWRNGDVYVKQKLYVPAKRYFADVIENYADTPVLGDAILSNAVADARLGQRDSALAVLRGLEQQFSGQPLGLKAQQLRVKMEKWPAEGDRSRRGHRPVEPSAPVSAPSSSGTSYAP